MSVGCMQPMSHVLITPGLVNILVKWHAFVFYVADESLRCSRKESQKGRQIMV
jgi:hypothetical protein